MNRSCQTGAALMLRQSQMLCLREKISWWSATPIAILEKRKITLLPRILHLISSLPLLHTCCSLKAATNLFLQASHICFLAAVPASILNWIHSLAEARRDVDQLWPLCYGTVFPRDTGLALAILSFQKQLKMEFSSLAFWTIERMPLEGLYCCLPCYCIGFSCLNSVVLLCCRCFITEFLIIFVCRLEPHNCGGLES